MQYLSTRGGSPAVSSAQAVVEGLAPDGGLYIMEPSAIPRLDLNALRALDYPALAARILSALMPDFSEQEALAMARLAYRDKFSTPLVAPLRDAKGELFLELFHGPTAAFKDVALCLLPHLMTASARKCGHEGDILILTATSGDTGKAALEGFRDVDGIRILVFYPRDGVSPVQKAQMVTQAGSNVKVCAVDGNFDDAQSGVKHIFSVMPEGLSSANSINIGRLVPQVVYYFSAYFDAVRLGRIAFGEELNYSVPTGNFGDILTDFLRSGVYDRCRPFHKTLSPSMDILISSNLERLLYLESGDPALVASLMAQLSAEGRYTVPAPLLERLRERFIPFFCDDDATLEGISEVWKERGYLIDTHTAVARQAARACDLGPTVILSTASPYKFPAAVCSSLGIPAGADEFSQMDTLEKVSGVPMPENLRGLRERPVLHDDCVAPADMLEYVKRKKAEPSWAK